ncbi:MAG: UDP-2,3-diacylglucosamine diphosphatase LpxI [Candidatus Omnitrophica bacterium]|nr:UDP-2,3-diacylglucosamine diphosphatase LpxI [Candidatus Omnitrophota bacterium]
MSARIAIIAGAGRFPFHVAQEAKRQGTSVTAFGIRGWADASLASEVDTYEEIAVGQLGRLIERLKSCGAREAIMAGKVTKEVLFDQRTSFDAEALGLLQHVNDFSVASVLGAIGKRLATEGITLLDSSTYLKANLCPEGVLSARAPSAVEQEDIRIGTQAARMLATLDIGQTVVVKGRVVVALEALEGTDAAIRRAHTLAGEGLVVVKMAAPNQDRRFDLPLIGPATIATLRDSGVSCLAVEAGTTVLLDREALVTAANASHMCLVGILPTPT